VGRGRLTLMAGNCLLNAVDDRLEIWAGFVGVDNKAVFRRAPALRAKPRLCDEDADDDAKGVPPPVEQLGHGGPSGRPRPTVKRS